MARARVRTRKSKKNKRRNKRRLFGTLIIIFIVWLSLQLFMPNFDVISLYDRMPNLLSGEVGLVINADIVVTKASPIVYDNGQVLLPLSILNKYVDSTILKNDKYVIAIKNGKYIRYEDGELKYVVNDKVKKGKVAPKVENNEFYVPMDVIKKLYNLDLKYSRETNILIMTFNNTKRKICLANKNSYIRETPSVKGFIVGEIKSLEEVTTYNEQGKWSKVVSKNGITGYVKTSSLRVIREIKKGDISYNLQDIENGTTYGNEEVTLNNEKDKNNVDKEKDNDKDVRKDKKHKGKISLLWYQVSSKAANPKLTYKDKVPGVNVVCFTWFDIVDKEGNLRDKVDTSIVKWAHDCGYKIWALVANPFSDSKMSHDWLSNPIARENTIKQLLSYCKKYNIDGINVDIESIKKESGPYYIQFIRELSIFTNIYDLTLSLDMYMPYEYSRYYGREEIGQMVDYFCLMAYDEHYRTSKTEGSVASFPWVARGIEGTIELVDKDKVLLGMPSYTRRWAIKNGEVIGSTALGMDNAANDLKENNAEIIYDAITGQNYGEYEKDGVTYKIWLEDELSVKKRLEYAKEYELKGVCTWKKGFERDSVWSYYVDYLKNKLK